MNFRKKVEFILNYRDFLNVKDIKESTSFWLVRSKKGVFYDEYKNNNFIALGWNCIDAENIDECDEEKLEEIKGEIKRIYKTEQDTLIFNKCNRFINEMNEGDIVMVPSSHNNEILFAEVGKYYEVDFDYVKEIEVINRIDSKKEYGTEIKCPYKKRREIKPIKIIKGERLNPNLFKVLASYHGISSINKYGDYILSSLYNLYTWKGNINTVINIEKKNDIGAKDFSELIYCITDTLSLKDNGLKITTKANVNSPGDVVITIFDNIVKQSGQISLLIFFIWAAISGVKIGKIDIPSIPDGILKILKIFDYKIEREAKKLDVENKKLDVENKKLDIENKKIDIDGKKKDNKLKNIELRNKKIEQFKELEKLLKENNEDFIKNLEKINRASRNLEVDSSVINNIINFDFFQIDDE
ncbi:hypothetical protein N2W49_000964 [Clostridium perfringens]|nr:hypothetical protein [Clostridium perfringens]EJT6158576.1 hypothetical protein [Clostridium perfringens]MDM0863763.1 hypothetical protein [Clostridium perfringens]